MPTLAVRFTDLAFGLIQRGSAEGTIDKDFLFFAKMEAFCVRSSFLKTSRKHVPMRSILKRL